MKLTKKLVDGLSYTGASNARCIVWDDSLPGLGCRIYPSNKKCFVLSYRSGGQKRLMKLGKYGAISLDEARRLAKQHIGSITGGSDPLVTRQRSRHGETVADLCRTFLEGHAKIRKRSWKEDDRRMRRFILPTIGRSKLKTLSRSDIASLHRRIGQTAPYEANRTLALLSVMFEFAITQGLREEAAGNPARRIPKFPEHKRDRWVTPAEIPRLTTAIDAEENPYARAALWLYLLTGARKSEVLLMRWADVDLVQRQWRLPTTKSGRTHYLPLVDEAVSILQGLPRQQDNEHVICGARPGAPLINISKPWLRVRRQAGLDDVRLHDIRRTVGSWLAQNGETLHLIGRVLNHSNASTTQIYARFTDDNVRRALTSHSDRLSALLNGTQPPSQP